jgi:hypothetical protein
MLSFEQFIEKSSAAETDSDLFHLYQGVLNVAAK